MYTKGRHNIIINDIKYTHTQTQSSISLDYSLLVVAFWKNLRSLLFGCEIFFSASEKPYALMLFELHAPALFAKV